MKPLIDNRNLRVKKAGLYERSEFVATMDIDNFGSTRQTRNHLQSLQARLDDGKFEVTWSRHSPEYKAEQAIKQVQDDLPF